MHDWLPERHIQVPVRPVIVGCGDMHLDTRLREPARHGGNGEARPAAEGAKRGNDM
jgi:hypothetical protein